MRLIRPSYEILTDLDGLPRIIERAGRCCYKSEAKIGPETADPFCEMLIKRGHESVIEHASLMVKFTIDRGVSHELVRHRLCSFSQESTRYCDYSPGGKTAGITFIIPPWCLELIDGEHSEQPTIRDCAIRQWFESMLASEASYIRLRGIGWKPEQARSVLPNSLKTEIVVTANLREWRHIQRLRTATAAHPQMREVMIPLFRDLHAKLPSIFPITDAMQ
jgi:thymidylate synthase (FAD)